MLMTSVSASAPTPASGTFIIVASSIENISFAGGNTMLTTTHVSDWTGTFVGTSVITKESYIVHPNGVITGQGEGTFITEDGLGSAVHRYATFGNVGPDGMYGTPDDVLHGYYTIEQGEGTLAGVHAEGTFTGEFFGTYDGSVHGLN
jgi:hypothetical protein